MEMPTRFRKLAICLILIGIVTSVVLFRSFKPSNVIQHQAEEHTIPPAWAAAPTVTGSPNVAVTSWRGGTQTFVLWTDGHITDASNNIPAKVAGTYPGIPPSGFPPDPPYQGLGITGSGRVAIGIVPTSSATYILFSNGTIRDPGPPVNVAVSTTFGWVTVPAGFSQGGNNIVYPAGQDYSPMTICANAGYTTYTGACKGATTIQIQGGLVANTVLGGWALSCHYGGGAYYMDGTFQILCIK